MSFSWLSWLAVLLVCLWDRMHNMAALLQLIGWPKHAALVYSVHLWYLTSMLWSIDQFQYIKIQPKTTDVSTRFPGINTEFVGFIPESLVLRSIVLGWILIYQNWSIDTCQKKVSADQYHVTILQAQVWSSSRSHFFLKVDRWPSTGFSIGSRAQAV